MSGGTERTLFRFRYEPTPDRILLDISQAVEELLFA
jgi:hypothetical protein